MPADISHDNPDFFNNFLIYIETIKGQSAKTAHEYFLDIRLFLRYMKYRKLLNTDIDLINEINISDLTINFISTITLTDIYDFLNYTAKIRPKHQNSLNSKIGLTSASRARKISALRTFFKYLSDKANLISINPMQNLDLPKIKKSLPRYFSVEQSVKLLETIEGTFKERDYLILTLFLNCGLRVSELVTLNLNDIFENKIRVLGKGNKERILYLNDACLDALHSYLPERVKPHKTEGNPLFVSRQRNRISVQTIKWLVKKYIKTAGFDDKEYSAHKLRHTAATLMYQNGVDIRTLQTVLGHKNLDTTMIYTHIENQQIERAANLNPLSKVKQAAKSSKEDNEE